MKTQNEMFSNNNPLQNKTCKSVFVMFRETFYTEHCSLPGYDDSENHWGMSVPALPEPFLHTHNKPVIESSIQVNIVK